MEEFSLTRDSLNRFFGENPLQVMLIDKQDTFRRKIRDILHGIGGFQVVVETASCYAALETAKCARLDLLITELMLEDGDGAELTIRLKQLSLPPPVVIFSATIDNFAPLRVTLAGADGYLMKGTSTRDIIRAFKSFELGGPAMQPAVTANAINLLVEQCKMADSKQSGQIDRMKKNLLLVYSLQALSRTGNGAFSFHGAIPQSRLSPQEAKVFTLLRHGQSNKQIAANLAISPYTVGKHVQNILRKLSVINRTQAVAYTPLEGDAIGFVRE